MIDISIPVLVPQPDDKDISQNQQWFDLGCEKLDKQEWLEAIKYFTWHLKENPDDEAAYTDRSTAYFEIGDYD